MKLRAMKLICLHHHQLVVRDVPCLRKVAGFDSAYLDDGSR
jgi:hypothetical protein